MAIHPSVLAWRIPWTGSLVGYSPWGCKESDTTEATQHSPAQHRVLAGSSFPIQEEGRTERTVKVSRTVICKVLVSLIQAFYTSYYICFKYYIVERLSFHDVFYTVTTNYMGLLVCSEVMNLPAMQETQETQVVPLHWQDPMEEEMATHSILSILAWETPWTEEPGRLQSTGSQRVT